MWSEECLSCLGGGEVGSEYGVIRCPDCDGSGKIGSPLERNEQRLREVERESRRLVGQPAEDVRWLIGEVRRTRSALLKILTAAQDAEGDDELLGLVRFEANGALGVYPVDSEEKPSE